jgi:hypothetical protein
LLNADVVLAVHLYDGDAAFEDHRVLAFQRLIYANDSELQMGQVC